MKKQILEKLNYVLPYIDDFEVEYPVMLEAIKMVESLPDSEPLDPHTCELHCGDEVEILSDSSEYAHGLEIGLEGFITCIDSQRECSYQVWDKFLYRSELKLIHRHGATIKEVGNE